MNVTNNAICKIGSREIFSVSAFPYNIFKTSLGQQNLTPKKRKEDSVRC